MLRLAQRRGRPSINRTEATAAASTAVFDFNSPTSPDQPVETKSSKDEPEGVRKRKTCAESPLKRKGQTDIAWRNDTDGDGKREETAALTQHGEQPPLIKQSRVGAVGAPTVESTATTAPPAESTQRTHNGTNTNLPVGSCTEPCENLARLKTMGFAEAQCTLALQVASGDIERATQLLLDPKLLGNVFVASGVQCKRALEMGEMHDHSDEPGERGGAKEIKD